jgi:hypothetical protein
MYCFDVPSLRKRWNALQHRQHRLLLGLFIAYERNKGKDSFWHPYLDLLPEEPGCAWLMQPEHLSNALAAATRTLGEVNYQRHKDWNAVSELNHISASGLFTASVCWDANILPTNAIVSSTLKRYLAASRAWCASDVPDLIEYKQSTLYMECA